MTGYIQLVVWLVGLKHQSLLKDVQIDTFGRVHSGQVDAHHQFLWSLDARRRPLISEVLHGHLTSMDDAVLRLARPLFLLFLLLLFLV